MSIDDFTAAVKQNFEKFSEHPFYATGIRALDAAYRAGIRSAPPQEHGYLRQDLANLPQAHGVGS